MYQLNNEQRQQSPTTMNAQNIIIRLCRKRTRAELSQTNPVEDDEATISTVVPKKRRISVVLAKKSVRFAAAATEVPADAVSDPTTWYTASDYTGFKENMKRDVIHLARRLRQEQQPSGEELDKLEYCPWGLEKYCSSTVDQLRAKHFKQQRIHAVLQQQALQKQLIYYYDSSEAVRRMASAMAQPVVNRALVRAALLQQSLLL